MQINRTSF